MEIFPTIRKAARDDVDRLASFNRVMARESEGKELDAATVQRGVQHVLDHPEDGFYLVAEVGHEVVGSLMITTEWSDWRNAHFWWIQSVFIRQDSRRKGVYRALHREVRARARAIGNVCGIRLYVDENNAGARKTYEAMGMHASHYVFYEEAI